MFGMQLEDRSHCCVSPAVAQQRQWQRNPLSRPARTQPRTARTLSAQPLPFNCCRNGMTCRQVCIKQQGGGIPRTELQCWPNYSKSTHSHNYDFVLSNTLSAAQKKFPGFINEYYDDEGWWALAWIDAYQHTHDPRYLEAAEFIFRDMTYGWDNTCSGGIWWSKDRKYKNAIANELFLSVAAELGNVTTDAQQRTEYLTWARKEWAWFSNSGMINEKHLVNDGLNNRCENNGRATFTYNQGVILGGLAALSKLDHSSSLLFRANQIAQAAVSTLTDAHGILHEPCEPNCGEDGTQFKGIFVRNLRVLDETDPRSAPYGHFIQANADSIWSQVHPPDYHLGEIWAPPFGGSNASTQSSALDTLVAAISLRKADSVHSVR